MEHERQVPEVQRLDETTAFLDIEPPYGFVKCFEEAWEAVEAGRVARAVDLAVKGFHRRREAFDKLQTEFTEQVEACYLDAREELPEMLALLADRLSGEFTSALVAEHGSEIVKEELDWHREASRPVDESGLAGDPTRTDGELQVLRWAGPLRVIQKVVEGARIPSPDRIDDLAAFERVLAKGPDEPEWVEMIDRVAKVRLGFEGIADHSGNAACLLLSLHVFRRQALKHAVDPIRENWMVRGLVLAVPDAFVEARAAEGWNAGLEREWEQDCPLLRLPSEFLTDGSAVGASIVKTLLSMLRGWVATIVSGETSGDAGTAPLAQQLDDARSAIGFCIYLAKLRPTAHDGFCYPLEARPAARQLRLLANDALFSWTTGPDLPLPLLDRIMKFAAKEMGTYYSGKFTEPQIIARVRRFLRGAARSLLEYSRDDQHHRRSGLISLISLDLLVRLVHASDSVDEFDLDAVRRLGSWKREEAELLWAARLPDDPAAVERIIGSLREMSLEAVAGSEESPTGSAPASSPVPDSSKPPEAATSEAGAAGGSDSPGAEERYVLELDADGLGLILDGRVLQHRAKRRLRRIGPIGREGRFLIALAKASSKGQSVRAPEESVLSRARQALRNAGGAVSIEGPRGGPFRFNAVVFLSAKLATRR